MSEEEQFALLQQTDACETTNPAGKDKVLVGAKEKEWEEYLNMKET